MRQKMLLGIDWNRSLYALMILLFLSVFLLSIMTPMVSDDFAYSFSFADWTRLRSVTQIAPSMAVHRTTTNGRVLVHGIVQLLLMLPRLVFALLNAGIATILLCSLRRMISISGKREEWMILAFSICFLCCFSPALGENVLWLTGAINYFWTVALSILFLLPFLDTYLRTTPAPYTPGQVALRTVLAFYVGTCSENVSLTVIVLASFFCFLSCLRVRRIPTEQILWLLFSLFGYVFLMSAPATAGRSGTFDVSALGYSFRLVFQAAHQFLMIPFLVFALLFAAGIFFDADKRKLLAAAALFLGGLLVLVSYIFAAYLVKRHLFFTVFFTLVACCILLDALCEADRHIFLYLVLAGISVLFLLQLPVGMLDVAVSYHKQQSREQQIVQVLEAGEKSAVLENYYPYTSYGVVFKIDSEKPEANINVSEYYGLDAVLGVDPPEESKFQ